jgi:hypothetical protein
MYVCCSCLCGCSILSEPVNIAAAAAAGFQLSKSLGWLFVPLGVAASLCLTSGGFVLQTRGFKHGSALVVCTTAAAASIVAGGREMFSQFSTVLSAVQSTCTQHSNAGLEQPGLVPFGTGAYSFKHGSALAVCTTAAAASIVGVRAGMLWFQLC